MRNRKRNQIIGLVVIVALAFTAALTGWLWPIRGPWYESLRQPAWNPPDWLFGPVWTLLYLATGLAAWLVWRKRGLSDAKFAAGFFFSQLVFNAAWMPLFAGLHSPGLAFVDVVLLWIAVVMMAASFWRHSRPAGWLIVPYFLWVSYAGTLNFAIWWLNQPPL